MLLTLSSLNLVAQNAGPVIESDTLEMHQEDGQQILDFIGNVTLTGDDLDATCEKLRVYCAKGEGKEKAVSTETQSFEKIIATGNVDMKQGPKTGTADKVTFHPDSGEIILEGNPVLKDKQGEVSGHRIVYNSKEDKAYVEGENAKKTRPKVTLTGDKGNWNLSDSYSGKGSKS